MLPRSTPRLRASSLDSSDSTRMTDSIRFWSSSGFFSRLKRYSPITAPSAIAWAQASGSRPAMPAPWTIVGTADAPVARRRRRAVPVTSRTASKLNSDCLPRPATRTRGVGSLPRVWMRVSSLFLPLISLSAMSWLMAPSSALSTAPVPPPGLLTPSNRLTMMALAGCWARSPLSTFMSTGTPFSIVHRHHSHGRCGGQSNLLLETQGRLRLEWGCLEGGNLTLAEFHPGPSLRAAGVSGLWRRFRGMFSRRDLMEGLLVGLAFLLYFAVRGAVVDRPEVAYRHALDVINVQRSMGIFWEDNMNAWIKDRLFLAQTANIVYFWLHFPLIIAFGIYLYYGQRSKYTLMRDAFLLSGAIALVIYWLYPVAPPRTLPELARLYDNGGPVYVRGFFDTMHEYLGYGYQAQSTQTFVNPYAAMPSPHFRWDLLLR